MRKKGLTYYQAETDRFQDIKIKRLKKQYGCEGYAVYTYLQNEIYRVEGCFMRFGDDDAFDCADYWNIDEEKIYEIINFCADIDLFDAIIWKTRQILTSREIQENYAEICRRAKKQTIIPEEIALTDDRHIQPATPEPLPLFQEEQPETITGTPQYGKPQILSPQSSAEFRGIPQKPAEKCTKEKKIKINPPLYPPAKRGETGGGYLFACIKIPPISTEPTRTDHNKHTEEPDRTSREPPAATHTAERHRNPAHNVPLWRNRTPHLEADR